jgi:hypothetical protein
VVSFTLRPPTLVERTAGAHWIGGWVTLEPAKTVLTGQDSNSDLSVVLQMGKSGAVDLI